MYAIVKTGGKQYKVAEGDTIFVEKLEAGGSSLVGHSGSFVDGYGRQCFRGQCNHTQAHYPSSSAASSMSHVQDFSPNEPC